MLKNPTPKKNVWIALLSLVFLLLVSNCYAVDEETYTFGREDVDKIIVWGETYNLCQEALVECNRRNSIQDEIIKKEAEELLVCEENSKKKDDIIKQQEEASKDVNKLIEKAVDDANSKTFWSKLQWGITGGTIGLIIGLILGLL